MGQIMAVILIVFPIYVALPYNFVLTHRAALRRKSSFTNYFFEHVYIENWAVFEKISLNLPPKAVFVAVTGETGSGKSMLIKALEYCAGKKKSKALTAFFLPESVPCDIRLNLRTVKEMKTTAISRSYTRTITSNVGQKKSFVEIDGKRVSAKDMQSEISAKIRFWPGDELATKSLQSSVGDKYLGYVDRLVSRRDARILSSVQSAYSSWRACKIDLDNLKKIKSKMESRNEFELISFYKDEIDSFINRISAVLGDIHSLVSDLNDSPVFTPVDTGFSTATLSSSNNSRSSALLSLIQEVDNILPRGKGRKFSVLKSIHLKEAKVVLETAESVLSSLFAVVSMPLSSSHTSTLSPMATGGRQSRLERILKDLDAYSRDIESVQASFAENSRIGDDGFSSGISNILDHIESASDHIKQAYKSSAVLDSALPEATRLLENIKKISFDWELLAKKHEVEKISLGDLARSWEDDLAAMSSIVSTLPAAINLEKSALDTYLELSAKLSSLRREAVVDLESYLSEILPQLNMQEGGVALNISYRKSPSLYGSDEITMLSTSTGSPVESVFSSGELARLSLAMEGSLLLRDRDIVSSFSDDDAGNEVEDEECLFVFDEIDAHIGGEASNVAARLLKRIGKSKQVIAITHNPLIAAAADLHIVIEKKNKAKIGIHSIAFEACGERRVAELARMATGSLETDAGAELARALLDIDYDDFHGGTASRA